MPNHIRLSQPPGDQLGPQLWEIIEAIKKIKQYEEKTEVLIHFDEISFVHPTFILAFTSIMEVLKEWDYEVTWTISSRISAYLQTIRFPHGLQPDQDSSWEAVLEGYENKNYLPIINFPAASDPTSIEMREAVFSKLHQLLVQNMRLPENYKSPVTYLISEITNNIVEHAGVDRGWLTTQYYPAKQFLDICIIDNGKGLKTVYQEHGYQEVNKDTTAIQKAMKGISTKSAERGFGLSTSKEMIVNGLEGSFVLMTGKGMLINNQLTDLPVHWPGTFVTLRLPKGKRNFQYTEYIE